MRQRQNQSDIRTSPPRITAARMRADRSLLIIAALLHLIATTPLALAHVAVTALSNAAAHPQVEAADPSDGGEQQRVAITGLWPLDLAYSSPTNQPGSSTTLLAGR